MVGVGFVLRDGLESRLRLVSAPGLRSGLGTGLRDLHVDLLFTP